MPSTSRYNNINRYNNKKFPIEEMLEKPAIDFQKKAYEPLLKDLQANILKHHRMPFAEYHFVQFESAGDGCKFLEAIADNITSAKEQLEGELTAVLTGYLTFSGYGKLGIPKNLIPGGEAFRSKMTDRVQLNEKDTEQKYDTPFDAIIMFAYDKGVGKKMKRKKNNSQGIFWTYMEREKEIEGLKDYCKEIVFQEGQLGNPMPKKYDFKENIANPRFFPGAFSFGKKKEFVQAMRAVKPAELAPLGIVLEHDKAGNTAFSCGSYGVFSKFEMKEKGFDKLVKSMSAKTNKNEEESLANIMGRFPDGTPLTLSEAPLNLPTNNFDYTELIKVPEEKTTQEDIGSRCPFHSHIRKANPRTAGSKSRQIVRRGMFYKEKNEKGLLFMSFQNSLENQFEYVLNNWMLNSNFIVETSKGIFSSEGGRDILFSEKGDEYTLSDDWNAAEGSDSKKNKITIEEPLISFKGGIYFFAPSISFFKRIGLFAKIAEARKNIIERNKALVKNQPVKGNPSWFLQNTVVLLGDKKVTKTTKKKSPFIPGTEIVLR